LPASGALRRVPAWAWLAGLVLASTLVRYLLARRVVAPWIMVDEIVYSELAKSFADSGEFHLRGEQAVGYGVVYPVLIAPAFALYDSIPDAYSAAKAVNALAMSLAAVPAYLLARRVLPPAYSLLAAVLALALPSLAYSATLMTENAFYAVFVLVALALVAYLERPAPIGAVLVLAAVALAWATRAQGLVLLPAVLTAPLLLGVRRYRSLYLTAAAGAAGIVVVQLLRGRSPSDLLGAYEPVTDRSYAVGATLKWLVYHAAELELALGVVPVVAAILLASRWRGLPAGVRALLAATLCLTAWLLVAVAAFAAEVPVPPHILERSVFYVAPLYLILLLVWIERGLPRPALPAAAVLVGAAVLPALLPYATVIGPHAVPDSPALLALWRVADAGIGLVHLWPLAALGAAVAAALTLVVPHRLALALPAAVGAVYVVAGAAVYEGPHGFRTASQQALAAGIGAEEPDWIDRAVRDDVAAVWTGHASPYSIWENEFFNRRVGTVYRLEAPLPGGLPEQRAGARIGETYALSDGTAAFAGPVAAEDEAKGLTVYRVDGRLERIAEVSGLYPNDTWSGRTVVYTRAPCTGGALEVTVASDAALLDRPQRLRADGVELLVGPGEQRDLTIPLRPAGGRCKVRFAISPTARAPGDPRELGLHFLRFLARPARG
jgi:hypothetical protein